MSPSPGTPRCPPRASSGSAWAPPSPPTRSLERDGARSALLVTEGFEDLLAIGNQARPDIFDLKIEKPSRLYEEVVEVGERVRVLADDEDADALVARGSDARDRVTGEKILVERAVDVEALRPRLRALLDAGVRSLAVVLLHSYTFREHEDAGRRKLPRRWVSKADQPVVGARADGARGASRTHGERGRVPHAVHPRVPSRVPRRVRRRSERGEGVLHAVGWRSDPRRAVHGYKAILSARRGRGGVRHHDVRGDVARVHRIRHGRNVHGRVAVRRGVRAGDGDGDGGGDDPGAAAGHHHRRRGGRVETHIPKRNVPRRTRVRGVRTGARVLSQGGRIPVRHGRERRSR